MSFYGGIDYSTRAIDIVLVDEDTGQATWHRQKLEGYDAFERARDVRSRFAVPTARMWDDVIAVAIEEPRGPGNGSLLRIQGAILACLPRSLLVEPLTPQLWRIAVGLKGNASKAEVMMWTRKRQGPAEQAFGPWPQDACDAYCLALAAQAHTRHGAAI